MKNAFYPALITFFLTLPHAAQAFMDETMKTKMSEYVRSQVLTWVKTDDIISAIKTQNAQTSGYSQESIDAQDATWAAQRILSERPLIDSKMKNAAAAYLAQQITQQHGRITEVIVMDARGLNVAQTAPTSDIWQGDEEKYTATYLVGPDAIHVGEPEQGESSQIYQVQVSMTVVDPSTEEPIGAVTISLDLSQFY